MSPYENRLQLDGFHRVGLVALVPAGSEDAVRRAAAGLAIPPSGETKAGIRNLNLFTRRTSGRTFLYAYCEFDGEDPETAQDALLESVPGFAALSPQLEPHPRAAGGARPWLRTELINIVGLRHGERPAQRERLAVVSRLHPDREHTYRTFHQTNWPGIVDTMIRCNYRAWTTFLFELGDDLHLFTYFEYIGTDREADDARMAACPVTQRWWKHVVPCLAGIPEQAGPWAPAEHLCGPA